MNGLWVRRGVFPSEQVLSLLPTILGLADGTNVRDEAVKLEENLSENVCSGAIHGRLRVLGIVPPSTLNTANKGSAFM
jgi:hypothetical protein